MKKPVLLGLAFLFATTSCLTRKNNEGSDTEHLFPEALYEGGPIHAGAQLGLKAGEIALTLDDGPVAETLGIAKQLLAKGVPVTYFMIGRNAANHMDIVKSLASMRFSNGQLANIIANHSWDHQRKYNGISCIACDGTDYALDEIGKTDDVIGPVIKASGKPYFFRAPGGNFFRPSVSSEMGSLATVNKYYEKYIGPIEWDVDGDVNPGICQQGASACLNSYISQSKSILRYHGIVVLAHDVSSLTRSFIVQYVSAMQAAGYKFVSLDSHPEALSKLGTIPQNEFGDGSFDVSKNDDGSYHFTADAKNAAKVDLYVDGLDKPLFSADGSHLEGDRKFSQPGTRFFTLKAYDANGKLIALKSKNHTIN